MPQRDATRELPPARAGRPRDPEADRAILAAALELLSEGGSDGLRVDAVAERAGVSKTTMYRRWATRWDLLVAALWEAPPLAPVDTGSLHGDLVALMQQFVELTREHPIVELLASLAAERQREPRLARELDPYVAERMRPVSQAFLRAVARGETAPDTDLDLAAGMFGGAILLRMLFGGATDRTTIERLAQMVVAAIGGESAGGGR